MYASVFEGAVWATVFEGAVSASVFEGAVSASVVRWQCYHPPMWMWPILPVGVCSGLVVGRATSGEGRGL